MEIFLGHSMCFLVPCAHRKFLCCEKQGRISLGKLGSQVVTAGRKGLQAKEGRDEIKKKKRSTGCSFVNPVSHQEPLCWALGDMNMNSRSFPG
jgi:hypothetical protein